MTVHKVLELKASSPKSWEDATAKAIKKASKSVKNIKGAWVKDQTVECDGGKVVEFRVTLKVTFGID